MGGGAAAKVLSILLSFQLVLGIPPVFLTAGIFSATVSPGGGPSPATSGWRTAFPVAGARAAVDGGTPAGLFFAHVGNGQGLVSDLVLTNPSAVSPVSGRVEFFGGDGKRLELSLGSPRGRFSTVDFAIAPLGATRIVTDGNGPLAT
jgi:hypothetical protein